MSFPHNFCCKITEKIADCESPNSPLHTMEVKPDGIEAPSGQVLFADEKIQHAAVVEAQVSSFVLVYLEKGDVLRGRLVDFLEKRHAEKLVTIVEISSRLETDGLVA